MRNGYTPLYKPKGEQIDACAQGRLLMLSAWPHCNERITLTAWDCQQMNLMAQELSHEDIDTNLGYANESSETRTDGKIDKIPRDS